jgi:hypothetical protein
MASDAKRAVADLAVAAVGAAVAVYILKNPPLRRFVWRLAKYGVGTVLPGYLVQETKRAWADTAPKHPVPAIMNE